MMTFTLIVPPEHCDSVNSDEIDMQLWYVLGWGGMLQDPNSGY